MGARPASSPPSGPKPFKVWPSENALFKQLNLSLKPEEKKVLAKYLRNTVYEAVEGLLKLSKATKQTATRLLKPLDRYNLTAKEKALLKGVLARLKPVHRAKLDKEVMNRLRIILTHHGASTLAKRLTGKALQQNIIEYIFKHNKI